MDMTELYNAIGIIGFPAATCWLVLFKLDASMKEINKTLGELAKSITGVETLIKSSVDRIRENSEKH